MKTSVNLFTLLKTFHSIFFASTNYVIFYLTLAYDWFFPNDCLYLISLQRLSNNFSCFARLVYLYFSNLEFLTFVYNVYNNSNIFMHNYFLFLINGLKRSTKNWICNKNIFIFYHICLLILFLMYFHRVKNNVILKFTLVK